MSKRAALVAVVVAAALAAAVVGATAALGLIGDGAFGPGGRALSEADVRRSFDASPATRVATPTPSGTGPSQPTSPHPSTTAGRKPGIFSSAGGAVYASCASGQATLTGWIPASGYATDGDLPGPAPSAWVKFKSGSSEITVTVTCVSGNPSFAASSDDGAGGHAGGHGGRGGSSGGGSRDG